MYGIIVFLLLSTWLVSVKSGILSQGPGWSRPLYHLQPYFTRNYSPSSSTSTNHSATESFHILATAKIGDLKRRASAVLKVEPLSYWQTMAAGAVSRSMAQTLLHPAYTYKTILQLKEADIHTIKRTLTFGRLLSGIDAQFMLSLPHGAFHFFVIDQVKQVLGKYMAPRWNFLADFTSSAISTVICSVISTPQMVLTDRLMAGVYPSLSIALSSIVRQEGVTGFYRGWWPALAQKIPSYGLTWMFFQQLQRRYTDWTQQTPSHQANFLLGALAAAGSVTVMIPMDTIKTRLVIQTVVSNGVSHSVPYKGVTDCCVRILREEGIGTFYRALPPRLMAVVPMIAIQFGLYESMKAYFRRANAQQRLLLSSANAAAAIANPSASSFSALPSASILKKSTIY